MHASRLRTTLDVPTCFRQIRVCISRGGAEKIQDTRRRGSEAAENSSREWRVEETTEIANFLCEAFKHDNNSLIDFKMFPNALGHKV